MTLQQSIVLALQCSILLTVFELGLQAIIDDVLYLLRRPSLLVRSFVALFVIMPICAVVMARAFEFRRPVEIALIALAISPIPPLLPVRQQKAGGHASYGLGLMAIAGVLSVVTVPLSIEILSRYLVRSMNISPWVIAKVVLVAALLPLAAAILLYLLVNLLIGIPYQVLQRRRLVAQKPEK